MKPLPKTWPYWAVITMLIALAFSLMLDLRISRNNERELSRRLYQTFKTGNTNSNR